MPHPAPAKRCVFKVGGSLLTQPDWPARLRRWLAWQPVGDYLGMVGGGELVEAMRQLDQLHTLDAAAMHWRCIQLLEATFEIARELVPEFPELRLSEEGPSLPHHGSLPERRGYWVRVASFYHRRGTARPVPASLLPAEGWDTTSDCLALLLAYQLQADRCVLFKSCPVAEVHSFEEAIDRAIVDRESARFARCIPKIELVQL